MRVLYNGTSIPKWLGSKAYERGVYRYSVELFRALRETQSGIALRLGVWEEDFFAYQDSMRKLRQALPDLCGHIDDGRNSFRGSLRSAGGAVRRIKNFIKRVAGFHQTRRLPWDNIDIVHTPSVSSLFFDSPEDTAHVITIHDIIPLRYPDFSTPERTKTVVKLLRLINFQKDFIICGSEATRREVLSLLPVSAERCHVVHSAVSSHFYPIQDENSLEQILTKWELRPWQYILNTATFDPRKNVSFLIRCYNELILDNEINGWPLVLTGVPLEWSNEAEEVRKLAAQSTGRVVLTGHVSDNDLQALYAGCGVFVYTPYCEGFGFPPLEAMQCGAPVITSDCSSLPEIVGEAAIKVSPNDGEGLRRAIKRLATDSALRADLRNKGLVHVRKFSWAETARLTAEIYRLAREKF